MGPGHGTLLKAMQDSGKEVIGVDYMDYPIDNLIPKDIKMLKAPVWNISIRKKKVDMVVCLDVLHIIPMDKREDAVKELTRLTKKWLVMIIPTAPFGTVASEPWFVNSDTYEKTKDTHDYDFLSRSENREFWTDLFKAEDFEEYNSPEVIPACFPKDFYIFKKVKK